MADTKFEMILGMLFLKISNTDVAFGKRILTWKSYTTNKALPTTEQVQLVDPKEFVIVAIDADSKTFVLYVVIWEWEEMLVHSEKWAQIQDIAQVKTLLFAEIFTKVPAEYFNYSNIFLAENTAELLEKTKINEHAIKLEESKQPPFKPIYSLGPMEFETLKTYIKTNLANGFIWPSKSPAGVPILFDWKPDESFRFCVDYWGFNNIIIKNQYCLLLISELLDQLSRARKFT